MRKRTTWTIIVASGIVVLVGVCLLLRGQRPPNQFVGKWYFDYEWAESLPNMKGKYPADHYSESPMLVVTESECTLVNTKFRCAMDDRQLRLFAGDQEDKAALLMGYGSKRDHEVIVLFTLGSDGSLAVMDPGGRSVLLKLRRDR